MHYIMKDKIVDIYTDGSCHTQCGIGAWVAVILTGKEKKSLSDTVKQTTHNRMELTAVIKSIEYILEHCDGVTALRIYTDSQYVKGLPARKEKLVASNYLTAKGTGLQNADLVKKLFELLSLIPVELIKVRAHEKQQDAVINYNRDADMLSRNLVRKAVMLLAHQ
jgi:ribonuclease HI